MRTELAAGADPHLRTGYADSPLIVVIFRNMLKVRSAGGWANYERLHLDRLTAVLTPKSSPPADGRRRSRRRLSPLRRVPPEVLRRIVAYAFHAGYY